MRDFGDPQQGDGVQVFLQILLHLFQFGHVAAIVLDEPEVYLHANLQQRLLGVLAEYDRQVIVATHSSEIIAALPSESLAWIDKSRAGAVRLPVGGDAAPLVEGLGSVFNLGLARVLRTKYAFFVEGDDLSVLRRLAQTLGIPQFGARPDLAVVPLRGSDNWRKLEAFDWVAEQFLAGAVQGFALFDRDFHTQDSLDSLVARLTGVGVDTHIWSRHELENYVLVPDAIARESGSEVSHVVDALRNISLSMREDAIAMTASTLANEGRTKGLDHKTVFSNARRLVDEYWVDEVTRIHRLPGKEVLHRLNAGLQAGGHRTVTAVGLASQLRPEEIATEVAGVLRRALRL